MILYDSFPITGITPINLETQAYVKQSISRVLREGRIIHVTEENNRGQKMAQKVPKDREKVVDLDDSR